MEHESLDVKVHQKKTYVAPRINIIMVELEHSVAAGSAHVMPQEEIGIEWEKGIDRTNTIEL